MKCPFALCEFVGTSREDWVKHLFAEHEKFALAEALYFATNSERQEPLVSDGREALRDQFAMAALTGLCARMTAEEKTELFMGVRAGGNEALVADTLADAMMQRRQAKAATGGME